LRSGKPAGFSRQRHPRWVEQHPHRRHRARSRAGAGGPRSGRACAALQRHPVGTKENKARW